LASPFDKALHYDVRQIVETTANHVVQLLQRRALLEEGTVHPLGSCINLTSPTGTDRSCFTDRRIWPFVRPIRTLCPFDPPAEQPKTHELDDLPSNPAHISADFPRS
jgi:hypothetical protein